MIEVAFNLQRIKVVAVTGNSMGWYTALAAAGAVTPEAGYHLVQTMGSMMRHQIIGGQVIYPVVDLDRWQPNVEQATAVKMLWKKLTATRIRRHMSPFD